MTAGRGDPVPESIALGGGVSVPLSELRFRFTPSGGPGGQHANRSSTRVEVRFDVEASESLDERTRRLLLDRLGPVVRVVADEERSQARNRQAAVDRLAGKLAAALRTPRPRRATRPSRAADERRLTDKRIRSERKQSRRGPADGD